MKVISTRKETYQYLMTEKLRGQTIGFVPTMGALHEGHLSLMRAAVRENDIPVASIFVNPTQFSPNEDFAAYPRVEERDIQLLAAEGVKVVFLPHQQDIYPEGYRTYVEVEELGTKLCGMTRPHFFRGVTTVVNLLFHTVQPDRAYFGLKDRQQFLILCRMVKDFGWPIKMVGLPIIREADGLAMSSRNAYLTPDEREVAPLLYRGMQIALEAFRSGETDPDALIELVRETIAEEPLFKIDYIELVNSDSLTQPDKVQAGDFIALAAFLGKARLIDNMEMS